MNTAYHSQTTCINHPWEVGQAKSKSKWSQATFCVENQHLDKLASPRTSGISPSSGEENANYRYPSPADWSSFCSIACCLSSCIPLSSSTLSRRGLQGVEVANIFGRLVQVIPTQFIYSKRPLRRLLYAHFPRRVVITFLKIAVPNVKLRVERGTVAGIGLFKVSTADRIYLHAERRSIWMFITWNVARYW